MQESVSVVMAATPEQVWGLVADVTQIGRYSPETFEAEWLDDATGPAVGVRFRGHVRRTGSGLVYWTTCTITECVPGEVFGFAVGPSSTPVNRWEYRLRPVEGGTEVTETYRISHTTLTRIYWLLFGRGRARTNREGMRATLERIKAEVERPTA